MPDAVVPSDEPGALPFVSQKTWACAEGEEAKARARAVRQTGRERREERVAMTNESRWGEGAEGDWRKDLGLSIDRCRAPSE